MPLVEYNKTFWSCLNYVLYSAGVLDDYAPSEFASQLCHSQAYPASTYEVHPMRSRRVIEYLSHLFHLTFDLLACSSTGAGRKHLDTIGKADWESIALCFVCEDEELLGSEGPLIRWGKKARKKAQTGDWTSNLDRWILVRDFDSFMSIHPCSLGCGGVWSTGTLRRRHEKTCVRAEDPDALCRMSYAETRRRPQLDLLQRLRLSGLSSLVWQDIHPHGLVVYDLETVQEAQMMPEDRKTSVWYNHAIWTAGYSATLDDGTSYQTHILLRPHYLDKYSLVYDLVSGWLKVALENKRVMEEKTAEVRLRLQIELEAEEERRGPNTYFARRLRNCLSELKRRCSLLLVMGWNSARFDVPCLVNAGLYAALRSLFGESINIIKKDSSITMIKVWSEEEEVGLKIVDAMVYQTPQTLARYLESHKSQLPSGMLTKGSLPYYAVGKTLDTSGQDTGYRFTYQDYYDAPRGVNTLDATHQQYEYLVKEKNGDIEAALAAGGWKEVPKRGELIFAQLDEEWEARGLVTGHLILCDYLRRDLEPLLILSTIKARTIASRTEKEIYMDYQSLSSFTFNWLLSKAEKEGVVFYSLGSRLTKLLREHTLGGLSFVSHRLVEAGMRIPPLRLTAPEAGEESPVTPGNPGYGHQATADTQEGTAIQLFDCNAMYGSVIAGPTINYERPICRSKSNAYAGALNDSQRHTACAQILAFSAKNMGISIESEYTSGEVYVSIKGLENGAEIERIWRETVGAYRSAERDWRRREKEAQKIGGVDLEDLTLRQRDEDGQSESSESDVSDLIDDGPGNGEEAGLVGEGVEEATSRGRRRISSSSTDRSASFSPEPQMLASRPTSPDGRQEKKEWEPKFTLRPVYRFRVDGFYKPQHGQSTVFEVNSCLANHEACPHDECESRRLLERDPDVIFHRRYFHRTFGLMIAEDRFRKRLIRLQYKLIESWVCEWNNMRMEEESDVAEFCRSFTFSASRFPLDRTFQESDIIALILSKQMTGLVMTDIYIPIESRLRFHGYNLQPIASLTSGFCGTQMLITTHYFCALREMADACFSNITEVIEFQQTDKLSSFVNECVAIPQQGDRENNPSLAAFGKTSVNSAFGYSLMRTERFVHTRLGTSGEAARLFLSPRFYSSSEVGRPGCERDQLFEISLRPKRVQSKLPVIFGFTILCDSKVALLQFAHQLTLNLRPDCFAITGGDTDSLACFVSSTDLDTIVRPQQVEHWARIKNSIFCDEATKRVPGLWKLEAKGSSMIHLSSKLYSLVEGTGEQKLAVRGANIGGNRLLLTHSAFRACLSRPLRFERYCRERGLIVLGVRLLGRRGEGTEPPSLPLSWSQFREGVGRDEAADLAVAWGRAAIAWEEEEERLRLQSLQLPPQILTHPLALTNISLQRDDTHLIRTIVVNKTILLGLIAKRQLYGDGTPLPLPSNYEESVWEGMLNGSVPWSDIDQLLSFTDH